MPAFITGRTTRAIALAALVAVGAGACGAGTRTDSTAGTGTVADPASATAALDPARDPAVQAILTNVQAARSRHDARALHQFQAELRDRLGAAVIARTDAEYQRVLADLRAADAAHDAKARAAFRAELKAICSPTSLTSALEPC
jgi:pimeloyl-ACP methyl ester carboxylesterase